MYRLYLDLNLNSLKIDQSIFLTEINELKNGFYSSLCIEIAKEIVSASNCDNNEIPLTEID